MTASMWKLPPKAKLYEALSAVADGRVQTEEPGRATVRSSVGDKVYSVRWSSDGRSFSSNDNASFWQGYIGYPIIAVLLVVGRLPYNPEFGNWLRGVQWKVLNEKHRRDYDKAVEEVLQMIQVNGRSPDALIGYVNALYGDLAALNLERARSSKTPPKGHK